MRHLRVFDYEGDLLADLPHVTWSHVTAPGVLVVRTEAAHEGTSWRAFAPGRWGEVYETPSTPVVPGPLVSDAALTELLDGSDAALIREAMKVHCQCDSLRCDTVLNAATAEEREAVRLRTWRKGPSGPPAPAAPLERCVRLRGHDPEQYPCYWAAGVWMWGLHDHHPGCPRHPSRYNYNPAMQAAVAVAEEGQPRHAVGVTSDTGVIPAVDPEHARPMRVGPYILGGIDRVIDRTLAAEQVNEEMHKQWTACAVVGPDTYPYDTWCTMLPGHDGGLHAMDRPNNERITWARRGGPGAS